jgi:hypothetical protein
MNQKGWKSSMRIGRPGERIWIPDSDCEVDEFYDDEKWSLIAASTKDSQKEQREIQELYHTKISSPALESIGIGG